MRDATEIAALLARYDLAKTAEGYQTGFVAKKPMCSVIELLPSSALKAVHEAITAAIQDELAASVDALRDAGIEPPEKHPMLVRSAFNDGDLLRTAIKQIENDKRRK